MKKFNFKCVLFAIIIVLGIFPVNGLYKKICASEVVSAEITNFSFENGTNKTVFGQKYYIPDGWEISHPTVVSLEQTIKCEGQKSIKVSSVSSGFYIKSKNKTIIKSDALYEVGFMVNADSTKNVRLGIMVETYNDSGQNEEIFSISDVSVSRVGEWSNVSVIFGTSQTTKSFDVKIEVANNGSNCYIDSVYMQDRKVIETEKGASIRISEQSPGIRFSGMVDKATYDYALNNFSGINVGMLILPEEYYNAIGEVNFSKIQQEDFTYLDINVEKWNNESTASSDGYYGFYCAMVDINAGNLTRKFCARAYLRYTENGMEKYIYSDFSQENNMRSIQEVAKMEIELNGNGYCEEDMAILEYFASAGKTN